MKKLLLLIFAFTTSTLIAQVGINTTAPSAMLHIYGTTVPGSAGGTINLLNQNFSSYTVTQNHTNDTDCTGNATQGWVTGTGNANVNCTSCTGTWLYISSDASGCGLNSTAIMNFTTVVSISKTEFPIDYQSKIVSFGSCFAENMATKFDYYKFQNSCNPFGILFHPVAIEKCITRAINLELFNENE